MKLQFTEQSWDDYLYWQKSDKKLIERVNEIINDLRREPFQRFRKDEPLKHEHQGCWSRRVNDEHRLVYQVTDNELIVVACRYHYK